MNNLGTMTRELCETLGFPFPSIASERIKSALQAVRDETIEEAARLALIACLSPPDGGSPSNDEYILCKDISNAIRALKERKDHV